MRPSALIVSCLTAGCLRAPATRADRDAPAVADDGGEPGDSRVDAADGRLDATAGESESEAEPGCTDAGPSVVIVEPDVGEVVLGASLEVVAEITSTDEPVDPSSAVACLGYLCAPLVWDGATTYSGSLDIGSLAPGCDVLEVRADDEGGNRGCDSVSLVRDPGPSIEITTPDDGAFFGPDDVMTFGLTITTGDLAGCGGCADAECCTDGDPASCPCPAGECVCCTGLAGGPIVTIGGEACTPESGLCEWTESIAPPIYEYTVSVSPADFDPDLVGASLFTVAATDLYGAAASASLSFTVDATGPAILIEEPAVFSIVGCVFEVCASVTDPAGVNAATVDGTVDGIAVGEWTEIAPDTWCGVFDVALLPGCDASPQIAISAEDLLGNASSSSMIVLLDCAPPIAEIDPPEDLRLAQTASSGDCCQCSRPFDPVGDDAVDDGDCVLQVFKVRARIEDRATQCPGASLFWKAGVDASGVDLIAYQGSEPLVVDSDADGWCDAVNPVVLAEGDFFVIALAPVPPAGAADFTPDTSYPAGCSAGEATAPPDPLCDATPLSVAIADYSVTSEPPALWAILPIVPDAVQCVGQVYDSGAILDGWVCLAVRARDAVGNESVSQPVRIYIDTTGVPYTAQLCADCTPNAIEGPLSCDCDPTDSEFPVCDSSEGCCDDAAFTGGVLPECGLAGCAFPVFPPAQVVRVD